MDANTGTMAVALTDKTTEAVTGDANTTYAGKTVTAGSTTYIYVESTAKAAGATGDKLNVTEAIDKLNETANTKAFDSMDAMMAAIKSAFSEDVKSVSSVVNDSNVLELKVEAFADLNDAVDLSLHVGADSSDDNKINMNIAMMSARGLGINGLDVSGEDFENATKAIHTITAALQKVSTQRSTLGAVQNRLEHTINNLDNVVENTTAAESQIRDTDMATEMVKYSNNNILMQAGQSMLAQANQAKQGVLSLLQ